MFFFERYQLRNALAADERTKLEEPELSEDLDTWTVNTPRKNSPGDSLPHRNRVLNEHYVIHSLVETTKWFLSAALKDVGLHLNRNGEKLWESPPLFVRSGWGYIKNNDSLETSYCQWSTFLFGIRKQVVTRLGRVWGQSQMALMRAGDVPFRGMYCDPFLSPAKSSFRHAMVGI